MVTLSDNWAPCRASPYVKYEPKINILVFSVILQSENYHAESNCLTLHQPIQRIILDRFFFSENAKLISADFHFNRLRHGHSKIWSSNLIFIGSTEYRIMIITYIHFKIIISNCIYIEIQRNYINIWSSSVWELYTNTGVCSKMSGKRRHSFNNKTRVRIDKLAKSFIEPFEILNCRFAQPGMSKPDMRKIVK